MQRLGLVFLLSTSAVAADWRDLSTNHTTEERETTQLDMCKGEFTVTEIATKYVDLCNAKMRRFRDTLATGEQRDRFFCHCLKQYQIWDRRDP